MKKNFNIIMIFILIISIFTGCSNSISGKSKSTNTSTNTSTNSSSIKYEYFYRGFSTMKQNTASNYPQGVLVIETAKDWHNFMDTYVPGILYNVSIDFSKESLIYDGQFSPNSIYAQETKINNLSIKNNKIAVANFIPNDGIYAQNIDGIKHCFVNIVKINKSAIPQKITNVYHKK